jgi:putative FmdB family regulatory protein
VPTYSKKCPACGLHFSQWQSIHDNARIVCPECGATALTVFEQVNTYAVGERGKHTAVSDATDRQWHKDMDAYQRFRHKGVQPPKITGSDYLEATAIGTFHAETGLAHRDEVVAGKNEEAKALMRGQS